jgi:hypothetical protein
MQFVIFGGSPPLRVIRFLAQLKNVCDQTGVSEAVALFILDDFLSDEALESYRTQSPATYPAAVHWLLSTYATESRLETATRALQVMTQGQQENVGSYSRRLQTNAAMLGALVPLSELKSLFTHGLREPLKALFATNQPPSELEDSVPLSVLVSRAEQLETAVSFSLLCPIVQPHPRYATRAIARDMDGWSALCWHT